ncbi:MAG: LuxR C-terminal-related transcriptional regulator [Acidobacteriota bacterium]|nr:LuxR C-terminal-related transcriptional regulator [Blastocatellia bacterium]MDW8413120.1 LuxR C-terminal-related transcriptional regulator [Acidobacteriota bacterium]
MGKKVKKQDMLNLLTEREREVLKYIAEGATSKEIGEQLGISRKTADAHRNNIKRKLRVDSIAHLVQAAIVMGLIEPQFPRNT